MDKFEIHGPCRLTGSIEVSGAKNAALPALSAVLLTGEPVRLHGLPNVVDIRSMAQLLSHLGVEIGTSAGGVQSFHAESLSHDDAPYDLVRKMRASILVLGPLLARRGHARVSLPGGCAIGPRPVNLHIDAFRAMGATIAIEHGDIEARVEGRLRGARIAFEQVTVTGTENVMMGAVLADGRTVLENAATEPEVGDLAELLRRMGGRISGDGTPTITIDGVERLGAADHSILPDRIEAGTYVVAGALAGDDVVVRNCRPGDLGALLEKLRAAGVDAEVTESSVRVRSPKTLTAQDVVTEPFPGFPTDLQAQFLTLMTQAEGTSSITERIFENRFQHALELGRMGADIRIDHQTAIVAGKSRLSGTNVMASDLRASAALVLAGLVAEGITTVHRIYHLDRGYSAMEEKLRALGGDVRRTK